MRPGLPNPGSISGPHSRLLPVHPRRHVYTGPYLRGTHCSCVPPQSFSPLCTSPKLGRCSEEEHLQVSSPSLIFTPASTPRRRYDRSSLICRTCSVTTTIPVVVGPVRTPSSLNSPRTLLLPNSDPLVHIGLGMGVSLRRSEG